MDECKNFEIRVNSCWAKDKWEMFIWARFFLDNSKITIRHVWSQVDKEKVILVQSLNVKFSWSFKKITSKGFLVDLNLFSMSNLQIKSLPKLLLGNCLKIWLIKRGYLCLSGPENCYLKIYKCVYHIFLIR